MSLVAVPLGGASRRLPPAGRLRTGVKTGSSMKAIETWRITSADETAIRQLAAIYGGTPRPWTDAPTAGQWEVTTETTELNVVLPPDPLGGTPLYEQWSEAGCQRRCDSVTCQVPTTGPDGAELATVPCICNADGALACRPTTRLSVILPDIQFGGVWRYESKSEHIAREIPGMVEVIDTLQDRGLTRAVLALEHRRATRTKFPFTIPVLRVPQSLDNFLAGASRVTSLGASPSETQVAIGAVPDIPVELDDEVCDAEVVEEVSDAQQEAWLRLGRQIPRVLGDTGQFKQWRESEGRPARPSTLEDWQVLVGEARRRYLEKFGPPIEWDPEERAFVESTIEALRNAPDQTQWEKFERYVFDEFGDVDHPELWTAEQHDKFVTWLALGGPNGGEQ